MLQNFTRAWNLLAYHHRMLRDRVRVRAYRDAIRATVGPGDVVLDIGTGTGLLAFFACAAGAKRVYALEEGPMIEVAKGLAAHNGLEDRIVFVNERSTRAELPEPVDVIVSETLWSFGIGEGLVSWVTDARDRFLREDGRIVPEWVEPILAPLASPQVRAHAELEDELLEGLDLSPLRTLLANAVHQLTLDESMFIGPPAPLCRIELASVEGAVVAAEVDLVCDRDGVLDGAGGWFNAGLAPGVTLSNRPGARGPNSWLHAYFPLDPPPAVTKGAKISWRVATANDDDILTWSATVDGRDDRIAHSTLLAVPLAAITDGRSEA